MRQVIGHEGHSRRWLLKAGAAFAGMAMATSAFPALASTGRSKNMILDEFTGEWVDYNPRAAYRYYRSNGDVPPVFRRQLVPFKSNEKPGTIIVDGNRHFLYLIQEGGMAMRYGIGVGKEGFGWSGIVRVGRTAKWPRWTPPAEMVARDPLAAKFKNGMPGGPDNPLGARALYLYDGGRDTIYRIHGTTKPWSIGLNVSSGCIRLTNDDVTDLYERVRVGAKVIVLMQHSSERVGV